MRLGVIREISPDAVKKARNGELDGFIYLKVSATVNESALKEIKLYDAILFEKEAGENCYKNMFNLLQKLSIEFPYLFTYASYNLFYPILKDAYWAVLDDYMLDEAAAVFIEKGIDIIDFRKRNKLKYRASILRKLIQSIGEKEKKIELPFLKGKIGARVDNLFCLDNYGYLPEVLKDCGFFTFWRGTLENEARQVLMKKNIPAIEYFPEKRMALKIGQAIQVGIAPDSYMMNLLLLLRANLIAALDFYLALAEKEPKALIVDAGECEGEGIILGQVAKKYNFLAVNIMNGTKIGRPNDKDTNFHIWVMHNEMMQSALSVYCKLPVEALPVLGHLGEDVVRNYNYSHTMNNWLNLTKDKMVIALFTSPFNKTEKMEVTKALLELLNSRNDLIVFVRPHPREFKLGEVDLNKHFHERMIVLPQHKQAVNSLYDLLLLSDATISFGSAVIYQSSWFGIPTITFEHSPSSKLLFEEGNNIIHVNNGDDLLKYLYSLNKKKSINKATDKPLVASRVVDFINNKYDFLNKKTGMTVPINRKGIEIHA